MTNPFLRYAAVATAIGSPSELPAVTPLHGIELANAIQTIDLVDSAENGLYLRQPRADHIESIVTSSLSSDEPSAKNQDWFLSGPNAVSSHRTVPTGILTGMAFTARRGGLRDPRFLVAEDSVGFDMP